MEPSAKSVILDLLSTLRRGSMPVRALIEAGALFGFSGNHVRVTLARLRRSGLVERDERGRYRLGASAAPVDAHVSSWRRAPARLRSWDGGWIAVHAPRAAASARERKRRRLATGLLGFRRLEPGLAVRPDNLSGGVAAVRDELAALDPELGTMAAVFGLRELDAGREQRARSLWDGAALERGYERTRATLAASERRLPALPREQAMVESFTLGGGGIRQVAADPLLPAPIVGEGALAALVETLRSYDRAGRACWAAFLEGHGVAVNARSAPADRRTSDFPASPLLTEPETAAQGGAA